MKKKKKMMKSGGGRGTIETSKRFNLNEESRSMTPVRYSRQKSINWMSD